MLHVAAINFGWAILLGSALHLYFYVFAGQQVRLKFDARPMEKSNRYGSEEIPLDRWFGSFHDGTEAATQRSRARKKRIFAARSASD